MRPCNEAKKRQAEKRRLQRLEIISPLFKRGYSYRQIQKEVMARLELENYSLPTVKADIDFLLKEWQEFRITNVDANIQLELQRIDNIVREAWGAWEKSKEDYKRIRQQQDRVPVGGDAGGDGEEGDLSLVHASQTTENVVECGDPRYLDVINRQLQERRKLLGLYAPEKQVSVSSANVKVNPTDEMSLEDIEAEIKRLMK